MKTIVTFQVKNGKLSFYGECKIGDVNAVKQSLFSPLTGDGEDEISPDAEWKDCDGNGVCLTNAMIKSGIGRIELDVLNQIYYSVYLKDITFEQARAIIEDGRTDLIKDYFDDYTEIGINWKRFNGEYLELCEVGIGQDYLSEFIINDFYNE